MKKNYLKKIFVAVVILLCSVTASAHDFEVGGIFYNITSDKTVAVTYQGNTVGEYKYAGDIIIPESVTYYGIEYNVTSIGVAAFVGCEKLTSIKIGNNITTIEDNAFAFCKGLTSIEIPNGVTSIGSTVFYFCSNLANITIPNSVINIDPQAFEGSLWYDNQPDGVVYAGKVLYEYKGEMTSFTSIDVKEGTLGIVYGAFNDCWYLTTITIPESVKIIGGYAFNNCPNLSSVTISNGVESIGEYAFRDCERLKTLTMGNGVKYIGEYAFDGCRELENIVFPNSIISMGEWALHNTGWYRNQSNGVIYAGKILYCYKGEMPSNTYIEVKDGTFVIGESAFSWCTGLTSVTIPNSITSIGESAFSWCTGLTSVTIPNSITSIGKSAFSGCEGLTSLTIPNSVTSIGDEAFIFCTSLTSVTIPNSVKNIGSSAFQHCYGLTNVTIGNSVKNIGSSAFQNCYDLTKIYLLRKNPASIDNSVFPHYDATLYVPQGSLEAYKAADVWGDFTNIVEFDATAIEDIEDNAPALKVTAGGIHLADAKGKAVAVYNAGGALVEKIDNYAGEEITLDKGIYILCIGDKVAKVKL